MNISIVKKTLKWMCLEREPSSLEKVYDKFSQYTMIPKRTYIRNLRLAIDQRSVSGCVVECGVWKGGMIAGMAEVLGPDRDYVLFDSFEGLPPPRPVDGPAALAWQSKKESPEYYNNCMSARSDAEVAMRIAQCQRVQIVQGWFDRTLVGYCPPEPISVLRLDGDWYESTMLCLRYLYRHLAKDGIVIIDDYYAWDGCAKAVHDFLSEEGMPARIRQLDNDVCFFKAV